MFGYKDYTKSNEQKREPTVIVVKENNGCLFVIAVLLFLILVSPFLIPIFLAAIAFIVAIFAAIL